MNAILPSSSDDGHHVRSDLKLVGRAIRSGWILSEEMMSTMPAFLQDLLTDQATKPRAKLAILKTYMAMLDQNIKLTELSLKEEKLAAGEATDNVRYVFDLGERDERSPDQV